MTESIFHALYADAIIPKKATPHSAGYDLYSMIDITIKGGDGNVLVPTGVAVKLPACTYGRISIRSGLAVREHLGISAGVIDADYFPGPICVVVNCSKNNHTYTITKGERFAQLTIEYIWTEQFPIQAEQLIIHPAQASSTHQGFGSTGKY